MGFVYARGRKLWLQFKNAEGQRERHATRFVLGQEEEARKALKAIEDALAARREADIPGELTVRAFAKRWLEQRRARGLSSVDDDASRLKHADAALGAMLLEEVRPRHVRALIESLVVAGKLAPRTVRHVFRTLKGMYADAVADELVAANPCQLRKGILPKKVDKDPEWRAQAIFTREEVETLISDERVPEDRRTFYALLFFAAGDRFGEASALTWRMIDATARPLHRISLAHSYSTERKAVKSVKTENPRQVPMHPTLARILAAWKLDGWRRLMGRAPTGDDLVVPSREGAHRSSNHMLKKFYQDLERLKLRRRRQHDLRRTFVSLGRADGMREDILRLMVHGPSSSMLDAYTTIPWETFCGEMVRLRVEQRAGKVIALPKAAISGGVDGDSATVPATVTRADKKKASNPGGFWPMKQSGVDGTRSLAGPPETVDERSVSVDDSHPLAHSPDHPIAVSDGLSAGDCGSASHTRTSELAAEALAALDAGDLKAVRSRLLEILTELESELA